MKKIFLVCYGGGHVRIMAPLYKYLVQHNYSVNILALTIAGSYLKEVNIPYYSFKDFAHLFDNKVIDYGNKLAENNHLISKEETIYYLGASFLDLVNELNSEEDALTLYKKQGRRAFVPTNSLKLIINHFSPDLVITTNSPRAEKAALIAAKELNIPRILINDNAWVIGADSQSGALYSAQNDLADYICVQLLESKNYLEKQSKGSKSEIVVTGTPVFDQLSSIERTENPDNIPRVLLADYNFSTWNSNSAYQLDISIRSELNNLAREGKIQLTFRPHPNQPIDYSAFKHANVSNPKTEVSEVIGNYDVVITAISTVGLEAKLLGLGLVSLEGIRTSNENTVSYAELGISTGISNCINLLDAINLEFNKSKNHFYKYSNNSLEKIHTIIQKLLCNKRGHDVIN